MLVSVKKNWDQHYSVSGGAVRKKPKSTPDVLEFVSPERFLWIGGAPDLSTLTMTD
jgi:hypothetical protein